MSERSFVVEQGLVFAAAGDTVTEAQLAGCNVEALVQSGHLRETTEAGTTDPPPPPPTTTEPEQ